MIHQNKTETEESLGKYTPQRYKEIFIFPAYLTRKFFRLPTPIANHFGSMHPSLVSSLPTHPIRNRTPWKNGPTNLYQNDYLPSKPFVNYLGID